MSPPPARVCIKVRRMNYRPIQISNLLGEQERKWLNGETTMKEVSQHHHTGTRGLLRKMHKAIAWAEVVVYSLLRLHISF